MTIEKDELITLVPHKGKMFLIDRITESDIVDWKIKSETKICKEFLFYDEKLGGVPNYALFEVAAQTISALTGLYVRENNLPPNMGFILSVSNFSFDVDVVKIGSIVKVDAFREAVVDNVYSFIVSLEIDGKAAGSGKLTVMEVMN